MENTSSSSWKRPFCRCLTRKYLYLVFSTNPVSEQKLRSPNHSFKFLCSVSLLSMMEVLQSSVWFCKETWCLRWWSREAIELLWSSTNQRGFESDSSEWCTHSQGSRLQNTTLELSAGNSAGQSAKSKRNFHIWNVLLFSQIWRKWVGFCQKIFWNMPIDFPNILRITLLYLLLKLMMVVFCFWLTF